MKTAPKLPPDQSWPHQWDTLEVTLTKNIYQATLELGDFLNLLNKSEQQQQNFVSKEAKKQFFGWGPQNKTKIWGC